MLILGRNKAWVCSWQVSEMGCTVVPDGRISVRNPPWSCCSWLQTEVLFICFCLFLLPDFIHLKPMQRNCVVTLGSKCVWVCVSALACCERMAVLFLKALFIVIEQSILLTGVCSRVSLCVFMVCVCFVLLSCLFCSLDSERVWNKTLLMDKSLFMWVSFCVYCWVFSVQSAQQWRKLRNVQIIVWMWVLPATQAWCRSAAYKHYLSTVQRLYKKTSIHITCVWKLVSAPDKTLKR